MIWFILTACLLLIAAAILWPFLKPETASSERLTFEADWTEASLKAALAAVDKDEARGVLSAGSAGSQRVHIAAQAEQHFTADENVKTAPRRAGFIVATAGLLAAPLLLFGLYMALGTPDPASAEKQAQAQRAQTNIAAPEINLEDGIALLEDRLLKQPDDSRAWAALGDLKIRSQDLVGAEAAFQRALDLPMNDNLEAARLWMILAMTRRSQGLELSDPSIVGPLEKSLVLDPSSPAAILLERINQEDAGN